MTTIKTIINTITKSKQKGFGVLQNPLFYLLKHSATALRTTDKNQQ